METLDYHLDAASAEESKAAGIWLWEHLEEITNHYGINCYKFLQTMIDGRYMSIEVNETPRALTLRANIVLRSLPRSEYMDPDYADYLDGASYKMPKELQRLSAELPSVKCYIFWRIGMRTFTLKLYNLLKTGNQMLDDYKRSEIIRPSHRKDFSVRTLNDELHYLLRNHERL